MIKDNTVESNLSGSIKQKKIQRLTITSEQIITNCVTDSVIVEKMFVLLVNDTIELKILCTPTSENDVKALVIGLLYSENIIDNLSDIVSIDFQEDIIYVKVKLLNNDFLTKQKKYSKKRLSFSHIKPNNWQLKNIHAEKIVNIIKELQKKQQIFPKTGAAHAAMLFNKDGEELYFAEDIGRHNGIDKVIGKCLQQNGHMLPAIGIALSSRVSFELINKIARAGIELVAAVSAPSSITIEAADYWQITLCGFVRGNNMNVYTHPERIFSVM